MKLSIVEPFAARPAVEESADAEVVAKPLIVVPLEEEPAAQTEEDSSQQEEKRSTARVLDYVEAQKLKYKTKTNTESYRARVAGIYHRAAGMEEPWDALGHHFDAKV